MKGVNPLEHDSLSDYLRITISGRKKKASAAGGGLFSKGSRGAFIREPSARNRRVVIKSIVMKNDGAGWAERRAKHAEYIQRDGTGIDGERAVIYGRDSDELDVRKYLYGSKDDPHEFRFIVSAEDAGQLDLKTFTRALMSRMERELGTKLQWMAADHYNTDNPHTHIVMRGVDELGNTLILDRDFISNGMRNLASELLTRELGERSDLEIRKEIAESLTNRRTSKLDRAFERLAGDSRIFTLSSHLKVQDVEVRVIDQKERLEFLADLGLAKRIDSTSWYLMPEMIPKLRELGFQGDIIKMMHREVKAIDDKECVILKAEEHGHSGIQGVVVARGLANELTDREFIVIEGTDGKAYYVELDFGAENMRAMPGDRVEVGIREPRPFFNKWVENIVEFGINNGSIYDQNQHAEWAGRNIYFPAEKLEDGPREYMEKHLPHLEKLEAYGLINQLADGRWQFASDIRARMALIQIGKAGEQPSRLQISVLDQELNPAGDKRLINGKEYLVYKPDIHGKNPIEGTVTSRGTNRRNTDFITLHSTDGKDYYVELPTFSEWEHSQIGDDVRIKMETQSFFKGSDHNILKCSLENGMSYSPEAHLEWSKKEGNSPLSIDASNEERQEYVENHVKRMILLERFKLVTKVDERKWQVDPEFNSKMELLKKEQEGLLKPKLKVEQTHISASLFGEQRVVQGRECTVYDSEKHGCLNGTVTARGISNRLRGSQYLVVKTDDQKEYYVQLQRYSEKRKAAVGDKVTVGWKEAQEFFMASDFNIERLSAMNGLIYDPQKHFEWSKYPGNSRLDRDCPDKERWDYIDRHVARMITLESHGLVKKVAEETEGVDPKADEASLPMEKNERGRWQVDPEFNAKMQELYKSLEAKMKSNARIEIVGHNPDVNCGIKVVNGKECIVFDKAVHAEKGLKGRVIGKGITNNQPNKPFLLVESRDKVQFLVDVSVTDNNRFRKGDSINIALGEAQRFFKKTDFAIARFASDHGNLYDAQAHREWADSNLKYPQNVAAQRRDETVEKCVQRMSFLEKYKLATPVAYRRWQVDPDILTKMKTLQAAEEPKFVQPLQLALISRPKNKVQDLNESLVVESRDLSSPLEKQRGEREEFELPKTMVIEGKEYTVAKPQTHREQTIEGVITSVGVTETGKRYITVKAQEGTDYVLHLSKFDENKEFEVGKFVRAQFNCQRFLKDSDLNIVEFSSTRGNVYDASEHLKWSREHAVFPPEVKANWRSPSDKEKSVWRFVDSHVLRMKFLERYELVKKVGDRKWEVDSQFMSKSETLKREVEPGFRAYLEVKLVNKQEEKLDPDDPQEPSRGKGMKR